MRVGEDSLCEQTGEWSGDNFCRDEEGDLVKTEKGSLQTRRIEADCDYFWHKLMLIMRLTQQTMVPSKQFVD